VAPTQNDAQRLVALGLHPVWLTAPSPGVAQSGKAPAMGMGWQNHPWAPDAPRQPFNNANLGVQTGYVDGAPVQVVVLDCDSVAALEWANANVPLSPIVTVTGKGEHRFYRRPAEEPGSVGGRVKLTLPDGTKLDLDVKGDGGQVVASPSVHFTGHVYRELVEWTPELLATIPTWDPTWVGSRTKGGFGPARLDADTLTRPGLTQATIRARVRWSVQRTRDFGPGINAANVLAALAATFDGTPLAQSGARGSTLRDVCWVLCRQCPEALTEQLVEYLTPAVQAMGDGWEDDGDWGLPGAMAKVGTARRKLADEDAARLATMAPAGPPVIRDSRIANGTPDAIDSLSNSHMVMGPGPDGDEPAEQPPVSVSSLLIVTHPRADLCWLRRPDGYYREAWALRAAYQYRNHDSGLKWASELGLADWWEQSDKKGPKPKTPERVFSQYSTPIEPSKHRVSLEARNNSFDPATGCFIEAVAPLRDIAPRYDAQLDKWLGLLAGPTYPRLVDYLATVTRVSKPTPALAIIGVKGCGKGFFIEGLSRLWHVYRAPDFSAIVGNFNEPLAKSPLLIADEYLPEEGPHGSDIFEFIRELVTARTHTVNRKNMPIVQVDGCVRFVYASNKADNLNFKNANVAAKEALAERFLYIDAMGPSGVAARDYLQSLPAATREQWIERDGFAAHCMWLAAHHKVTYQGRLLVEGNGQGLIDLASNSKGPTGHLCEALCRFLLDPNIVRNTTRDHWLIEDGQLWVATRAFEDKESWEQLVPSQDGRRHSTSVLGTGLAMLSVETKRKRYKGKKTGKDIQAIMHRVDVAQVLAFASRTGLGDPATILATLGDASGLVVAALEPGPPPSTREGHPIVQPSPTVADLTPLEPIAIATVGGEIVAASVPVLSTAHPAGAPVLTVLGEGSMVAVCCPDPAESLPLAPQVSMRFCVHQTGPGCAICEAAEYAATQVHMPSKAECKAAEAVVKAFHTLVANTDKRNAAAQALVARAAKAGIAAAKKAAKARPKWEREVAARGPEYATPTELHPMVEALATQLPATAELARALCAPFLLAAQTVEKKGAEQPPPLTYARLVLSQRAYLRTLQEVDTMDAYVRAAKAAVDAWMDRPNWPSYNAPVGGETK
jgi:hypothetical protein